VNTPSTTLQEMNVQDKFVIVGVTANGVMPQLSTPAGLLEPHKIQTALAESILIENSPYVPDYALAVELILLVSSILFVWLLLNGLGITMGIAYAALFMVLTVVYGYWTVQQGVLIDVTWTLMAQFITGSTAFYLRFREQYKLRQQIKKQFEHYLDPRQIKRLQEDPSLLKLGGEKRYCTYLFTDVRGFTAMSERLTPTEVTKIINIVLTQQVEAVQKYGGMVDKFIGDAMMAVFNAPLDLNSHEDAAINAGKQIIENMTKANEQLKEQGIDEFIEIGIGINSGEATIGNMGSDTRFDYSCIGDSVNLAARLESSTKEVKVPILIGDSTCKKTTHTLSVLPPIKVKGKTDDIKIFTLLGY
jgi:adenylate cyclase